MACNVRLPPSRSTLIISVIARAARTARTLTSSLPLQIGDFSRYSRKETAAWLQMLFVPAMWTICALFGAVAANMTTVIPRYEGVATFQPFDLIENGGWLGSKGGRAAAFFCSAAWALGNMTTNITAKLVLFLAHSPARTPLPRPPPLRKASRQRALAFAHSPSHIRSASSSSTSSTSRRHLPSAAHRLTPLSLRLPLAHSSISSANDLASLFPKWVNIFRGQMFAVIVGVWAFAPWKVLASASSFISFMAS